MKRLAFVVIACCGGGSAKPKSPSGESPCVAMASHVAETTRTKGNTDNAELKALMAESAEVVQPVLAERCQADTWSAEAIDCHNKLTNQDSAMGLCGDKLTEAQRVAVEKQLSEEFAKKRQQSP